MLEQPIDESVLKRLEAGMAGVVNRRDQAAKAAAFAAALPSCFERDFFTVQALRRGMKSLHPASSRQLRHFIDGAGWDVDRLRAELVACAVDAGVDALVLETCEIPTDKVEVIDIVSIHLLGSGFSLPVGWRRMGFSEADDDRGSNFGQGELDAVAFLIRQLQCDYLRLGYRIPGMPVISLDYRYGESETVRKGLAGFGLEHILEVGPEYAGFEQPDDPYASLSGRSVLCDQIPFAPGAPAPPPQLLDHLAGPESREFVVPLRRQGEETYAIARPEVKAAPGALAGHHARRRAAELGRALGRFYPPNAAKELLVANFRHQNEAGWEAAALIASALQATFLGLFPREPARR